MTHAILASALVGSVCGLLSTYLILKGWSLIGDALAHAIVPGVAIAYFLSWPYALGALLAGGLATFSMGVLKYKTKLREDAVIGFIFTSFFAIGLLLISFRPVGIDIQAMIFGNILSISKGDLLQVFLIASLCLILILWKWKDLMVVFFDQGHGATLGLPVRGLYFGFFALLCLMSVISFQIVGAFLVISMIITPGATAYLLSYRFQNYLVLGGAIGGVTAFLGAYLSYFFNMPPGPLISFFQTILFMGVLIFNLKNSGGGAKRNA